MVWLQIAVKIYADELLLLIRDENLIKKNFNFNSKWFQWPDTRHWPLVTGHRWKFRHKNPIACVHCNMWYPITTKLWISIFVLSPMYPRPKTQVLRIFFSYSKQRIENDICSIICNNKSDTKYDEYEFYWELNQNQTQQRFISNCLHSDKSKWLKPSFVRFWFHYYSLFWLKIWN